MTIEIDLKEIEDLRAIRSEAKEQMRVYAPQIMVLKDMLYKVLTAHCYHWKRFVAADEKIALMEKLTRYPMGYTSRKQKGDETSMIKFLEQMSSEERQKLLEELEEEEARE